MSGWEKAEAFLSGLVIVVVCVVVTLVMCALLAWPVMLTLGAWHINVTPGIPALGFLLTWLTIVTMTLVMAFITVIKTLVKEAWSEN